VPRLVERSVSSSESLAGVDFWNNTQVRIPSGVGVWTDIISGKRVTGRRSWVPLSELTQGGPWIVLYGEDDMVRPRKV